jgi:hypothetical protein
VLKSIDVLIGLTVVLLALSMTVTVITQALTAIANSRGRHLRRGITDLLQQLDPALDAALSKAIATKVLTHPLVSGSNTPLSSKDQASGVTRAFNRLRRLFGGPRLGSIVHREELTKLLMALVSAQGSDQLEGDARTALSTALINNGISNPDATLKDIRTLALQFERSSPELSHMARQNMAILHAAESDFVAKINNWFDQTMDRTSQRFTGSTRAITFAGAFLVAFGLQVDTPLLVNRLAADENLRRILVDDALKMRAAQPAGTQNPAPPAAADAPPQQQPATQGGTPAAGAPRQQGAAPEDADTARAREYRELLATYGIITLPTAKGWAKGFTTQRSLGMLMTALLLCLGAPFWYGALGNLLQLRSVLAVKDDVQRAERQLQTPVPVGTAAVGRNAAPAVAGAGERGDLAAIG